MKFVLIAMNVRFLYYYVILKFSQLLFKYGIQDGRQIGIILFIGDFCKIDIYIFDIT